MVCDGHWGPVVRVSPAAATGGGIHGSRSGAPMTEVSRDTYPSGQGTKGTLSGEWQSFDWGMCWSNSGKRAVVGPGLGRCVIVMCISGAGATGRRWAAGEGVTRPSRHIHCCDHMYRGGVAEL